MQEFRQTEQERTQGQAEAKQRRKARTREAEEQSQRRRQEADNLIHASREAKKQGLQSLKEAALTLWQPVSPPEVQGPTDAGVELSRSVDAARKAAAALQGLTRSLQAWRLYRARRRRQRVTAIAIIVVVLLVAASIAAWQVSVQRTLRQQYDQAVALLDAGRWEEARALFVSLQDYHDAPIMVLEAYYREGMQALETGELEKAREAFQHAGKYRDAEEMVSETYYREGKDFLSQGDEESAIEILSRIPDYKDVRTLTGGVVFFDRFSSAYSLERWDTSSGEWVVLYGVLSQRDLEATPAEAMVDGLSEATEYAFEFRAQQVGGHEGFLAIFRFQGEYVWWDIGGWGNTFSMVEGIDDPEETETNDTVKYGQWYTVRITVNGNQAQGYLDGKRRWVVQRSSAQVSGRASGLSGLVGVGTWSTQANFDDFKVTIWK